MKYTAKYFIEKFEKIPEDRWTIGQYIDEEGRYCALGHCGAVRIPNQTEECTALFDVLPVVTNVNDATIDPDFKQLGDTPKERILNALMLVEAGIWREIV